MLPVPLSQSHSGTSVDSYTVDRWYIYQVPSSKGTWQQNAGSVTPPNSFKNYLGFTTTSAYSVTSSDEFTITQKIEGFNVSDLGFGTASASTFTFTFWVRSSLTGTFGGAFTNAAADRSYPFSYTISAANTWEQKTITLTGDTTGTWNTTNGAGLAVVFSLGVGSGKSATAGSWQAGKFLSTTGATSVVGTNGATFYITGVQLEAGTVATPFEQIDYGRELIMCQRYYIRFGAGLASGSIGQGLAGNLDRFQVLVPLPVEMRATPSVSGANLQVTDHQNNFTVTAINVMANQTNRLVGLVEASTSSNMVQFRTYQLRCAQNTAGFLEYSAEL